MQAATSREARMAEILFALSLLLFLATRLVGLERFPIFFFCDEAVQTVKASELLENHGRSAQGEILPTYFDNGGVFNLSIGAYAQVPPTLLAGHSVFATRATQVLLLLPAMAAAGLILRDFLGLRFWWIGVLLLSTAPAWFLHTRIAFELMLATGAYVGFLYFYLRYRTGRTWSVLPAALCAALTFYGYNAFQPVLAVTGAALLLVDVRHHWKERRAFLVAIPVLLVCALPYLRFVRAHLQSVHERLSGLNSYWVDPALSTGQKWTRFAAEYAAGFSPSYWFGTDEKRELIRHQMKGYPYLFLPVLPLVLAGAVLCAVRIRSPGPRTMWIALLAAPVGGALIHPGVTRTMIVVVVASMLAAIALDALLVLAARRAPEAWVGGLVFLGFAGLHGWMLTDSLLNSPWWFSDYGMFGLQYGAKQLFGEVRAQRVRHPGSDVYVSPVWANDPDDLLLFFCPSDPKIALRNIDYYGASRQDLTPEAIQVLTAGEWDRTRENPKFEVVRKETMIPLPDGHAGFYFARLRYSPRFDALLAEERRERRRLIEEEVVLGGEPVCSAHPRFDLGAIANLFDGDPGTLVRTDQVNPAVVELRFDRPHRIRGFLLSLLTSGFDAAVRLRVDPADGSPGVWSEGTFAGQPADPLVQIDTASDRPVRAVRLEILMVGAPEDMDVHLREVTPIWDDRPVSSRD
jgi:hypothetical protein